MLASILDRLESLAGEHWFMADIVLRPASILNRL
jgi:hypothetical protein